MITKATFKPTVGEINGKQFGVFTEQAGYISTDKKIESFMYSGQLLRSARMDQFDYEDEIPIDDRSLDVRDFELSEVGALMASIGEPLDSSAEMADKLEQKIEKVEGKESEVVSE